MNTQMIILANDAHIQAYIFGQLAVHPSSDGTGNNVVTHIKSGCAIAEFSWFADAQEFAEEADKLMDFDGYAQALISSPSKRRAALHFKLQIAKVKELRESYTTYMHDRTTQHPDATRKQLAKRVTA